MSTAVGFVLVAIAVVLQVSVLPAFSIFGATPNLLIVLLVAWMTVRSQQEALLLIPAAGFAQGLLDSQPLGLAMLALAPLILMTEVRELRLVESNLLPAVILTALATLVYEGVMMLALAVTGERMDWLAGLRDALLPAAIANVLLLLPVYGLVRLASLDLRRQPAF
ncbi:MAG: rod shape-determining protein MreD [Chloroflexi bacterium]|nr:rod shape-determining protein MreD [Chloroflexota bacterium]